MHSDILFCFSSLSFSPSSGSQSFIYVGFFRPSWPFIPILLLLLLSLAVHISLLGLSVTAVHFLVVYLSRLRPLTRSLQLLVAVVGLSVTSPSKGRLFVVLRAPLQHLIFYSVCNLPPGPCSWRIMDGFIGNTSE